MRILHVSHYLPPHSNGGVENYTVNLASEQAKRGDTVEVFARGLDTSRDGIDDVTPRFGGAFRALEMAPGSRPLWTHQRVRWDVDAQFRKLAADFKPDIVHFQHLLYQSLHLPRIAREAGAATVFTLHDLWTTCPVVRRVDFRGELCERVPGLVCAPCIWNGQRARLIPRETIARVAHSPAKSLLHLAPTMDELGDWLEGTRRFMADIDLLVCLSRFYANWVTRLGIMAGEAVLSDIGIARPTCLESPAASRPRNAPLRFGVIGSDPLKGVAVAVKAFRQLADVNARLLVWGKHSENELPSNVELCGPFGATEIETVFDSFDVLIAPSLWWENGMLVIREAFARNKPVIASDLAGIAEIVHHEQNGLLFPPGDVNALTDAVRRLISEPQTLERLRANVRPPQFLDEHAAQTEKLYDRAQAINRARMKAKAA